MKTSYQMFCIVMFLLVLSAPGIKHVIEPKKERSIVENRQLATFPQKWDNIETARNGLEAYLKDHFGLRDSIIKRINAINYILYKETTSKRVTIGKNGFLFLNSHGSDNKNSMLKSICDIDKPKNKTQSDMKSGVSHFISHHTNQGIQTAVAIIPTKSRIYSESLPDLEAYWCQKAKDTWIDKWVAELNHDQIIYPLTQFRTWKNSFPVYLTKRFHWNGTTPYQVSQLILDYWNIEQELLPEMTTKSIKSDLSNHLSGLDFYDETIEYTYPNDEITRCLNVDCIKGFKTHYNRGLVQYYKRPSSNPRRLLVLSDSFGPGITRQFPMGFSEVYSIDLNHLQRKEEEVFFKWIVETVKPSHLLYVMHDGGITWQMRRLNRVFSP